jgi:hypothetical protein
MSEAMSEVIEMRGQQFRYERNDCTVTAFAKVTGLDYAKANQILTLCGRRYGKGHHIEKIVSFLKTNTEFMLMLGIDSSLYQFTSVPSKPLSVGYLRLAPKVYPGRYLVTIREHAFAMIDGVITDNCSNHMTITGMWKLETKEK